MATIRRKKPEPFALLQRDPGPWSPILLYWLATLGIIIVFGLVMLFSASYTTGYLRFGDSLHYIKSQVLCLGLGLVAMFLFSYVDHRLLRRLVWPGYFLVPALLVLGCISMCMQFYAAMAIGHSFGAHKGAMSVAAYIALQIALGCLSNGLAWLLRVTGAGALISRMLEQMQYGVATNVALLGAALAAALLAAVLHLLTAYFLTHRLNLE